MKNYWIEAIKKIPRVVINDQEYELLRFGFEKNEFVLILDADKVDENIKRLRKTDVYFYYPKQNIGLKFKNSDFGYAIHLDEDIMKVVIKHKEAKHVRIKL